jgi:hypothetical protein
LSFAAPANRRESGEDDADDPALEPNHNAGASRHCRLLTPAEPDALLRAADISLKAACGRPRARRVSHPC